MSHIVLEPTPVKYLLPTAYIFTNDDCTGDQLAIELEEGKDEFEVDFWTLLGNNWNDKGASVKVPNGYTLTLWQHEKGSLDEVFNGSDTCQKMSGNVVRQMSHIRFEPTPEKPQVPIAYVYDNDDCTGDSLPIEIADGQ